MIGNGNNFKLKIKYEFSLSMGLMLINHSIPYNHSTTILCDNQTNFSTKKECDVSLMIDRDIAEKGMKTR